MNEGGRWTIYVTSIEDTGELHQSWGIQMNLETSQGKDPKVDGVFSDISHYRSAIDVADDVRLQSVGYRAGRYPRTRVFHSKFLRPHTTCIRSASMK